MALGPGKYDDELSAAIERARRKGEVEGGMLVVFGAPGDSGFSAQLPPHILVKVPSILRHIADQIEADMRKGRL